MQSISTYFQSLTSSDRSDTFPGDSIWGSISRAESSDEARTLKSKPLCLRTRLLFKQYISRVHAYRSNPQTQDISKYGILDFRHSWHCDSSPLKLHSPSLINQCNYFSVFLRGAQCAPLEAPLSAIHSFWNFSDLSCNYQSKGNIEQSSCIQITTRHLAKPKVPTQLLNIFGNCAYYVALALLHQSVCMY